jgi:phenylacetic acid degradation operon negative regulatory protein
VRARSAVFDVYGDHLAARGYWAPVSAVITLLETCHIAPPATRTAVSRLTAQGWLERESRHGARGYAATQAARDRLSEASARIYREGPADWDGRWHVVVTDRPGDRGQRDRVTATLGYLGYGRMAPQTWLAARANPELAASLDSLDIGYTDFTTSDLADPEDLVTRTWDLTELAHSYRSFVSDTAQLRDEIASSWAPAQAYAVRTALVHRWRKFLFLDPALPTQVLPADWPGQPARELFLDVAGTLSPAARIFVSDALAAAGAPTTEGPNR